MSWKNACVNALLWLLSPETTRPRHDEKPSRFLIVSTTGMGDTLWATPSIRALRQTYPDSYIAALTSEMGFDILSHNHHLDELFSFSTFTSLVRLHPTLKKKQFDAVLLFHASQRSILPLCALLEAPYFVGTQGLNKGLDHLLSHPIDKKPIHEIDRRFEIIKTVGAHISDTHLEMPIKSHDKQEVDRFLARHGIPDHLPLIGIHPGAANEFKQWPAECFIEVGRRLTQHLGAQVIVSGSTDEALLALEVASGIPGAIPMAGELPLPAFCALQKRMTLFLTNDTGPMHLAFAAKTPTVAIFAATDPFRCGPYNLSNVRVLSAPRTCTPCRQKKCAEPFCLLQIGPDAVYDAAVELAVTQPELLPL